MVDRVFCRLEAVDPFDDVPAAEIRATSCNLLALDDRVRVVVVVFLADVGERDWYVSYPGCSPRTWRRMFEGVGEQLPIQHLSRRHYRFGGG